MIRRSCTVKSLLPRAVFLKGGYNAVQGDFSVKKIFFPAVSSSRTTWAQLQASSFPIAHPL